MPEIPREKPDEKSIAPQQSRDTQPQAPEKNAFSDVQPQASPAPDHEEYKKAIEKRAQSDYKKIDKLFDTKQDEETLRLRDEARYKYEKAIRERYEKALRYTSITERGKLLIQAEAEAEKYINMIEAFVYKIIERRKKDNKEPRLDKEDLYELSKLAESLPKTLMISREHQDLLLRAARNAEKGLRQKDLIELANLVRPEKLGGKFENLECAPVGAAIMMLPPHQRLEVAKLVMDKNPNTARQWATMMVASGALTVAQGQELWKYAMRKGYATDVFSAKEMADLRDDLQKTVKKRIDWIARDDTNPALKMLTLRNFGVLAGTAWGMLTFLFNGIVALKSGNYDGLKTYGLVGLGAAMVGLRELDRNKKWPGEDFLKSKSAEEKEKSAIENAEAKIMNILADNPELAKYLRNGGYATILMALHNRMRENKPPEFTFEDLEQLAKNNPNYKAPPESLKKNWPETAIQNMRGIAKLTAVMQWPLDSTAAQTKFNLFYNKYAKTYGLI